jgi:hypothetical protein
MRLISKQNQVIIINSKLIMLKLNESLSLMVKVIRKEAQIRNAEIEWDAHIAYGKLTTIQDILN